MSATKSLLSSRFSLQTTVPMGTLICLSLPLGSPLILTLAVAAPFQVEGAVELQVDHRIDGIIAHQVGVAPVAAVAPIGTAVWHVFQPQETHAAIPAVPGFDVNSDCINHRLQNFWMGNISSKGVDSVNNNRGCRCRVRSQWVNCSTYNVGGSLITFAVRRA